MAKLADQTSIHVRRAIEGERGSVAWLISHFQPLVEAQIRLRLGQNAAQEDVEDLAQELWLVTLRRLRDLEPREGRLAPVLVRFLGTTAIQIANNFLRQRIRQNTARMTGGDGTNSSPKADEFTRETRGVVSGVIIAEVSGAVRGCLERLSPHSRDVLVLRVMEQRSNQEIAEMLGLVPNTVAVRYRRALQDLRTCLPEDVFDEFRQARW